MPMHKIKHLHLEFKGRNEAINAGDVTIAYTSHINAQESVNAPDGNSRGQKM